MGSANFHGAPHSQKCFYRSGFALLPQLAFHSQPIIKIVARVASPIQIKFASAMLDLFRISITFAVGALLVLIFVTFHILSVLFLDVLSRFNALGRQFIDPISRPIVMLMQSDLIIPS